MKKKKINFKKTAGIGASVAMACALVFGAVFGSLDFSERTVEGGGC